MTDINLQENNTENSTLYSSKAISGATFLGGPLAAGYLIGENYKALNKPDEGRTALIIGIVTTILLFGGIFMLPTTMVDKIPRQIIPLIYTAFIWGFVEWKQGDILKAHKENNNSFYSGWRAAGVGVVSLLIIGVGLFAHAYLSTDNELYDKYDAKMEQFSKNENETLVFFDHLNTETRSSLLQELDEKTIPKWKENVAIINKTNSFKDLPAELSEQNQILLRYSKLRIQAFELFRKAIEENSEKYASQLEQIHKEIDIELGKLN